MRNCLGRVCGIQYILFIQPVVESSNIWRWEGEGGGGADLL